MIDFTREFGQIIEASTLYNPHQDGVAKRSIRTVIDRVRTAMIDQDIPDFLWPEVLSAVVHVTNRVATRTLDNVTLMQFLQDQINPDEAPYKPDLSHLKVLRCKAYVLIEEDRRVTLEKTKPRAEIGILIGYDGYNIWRVYILNRPGLPTAKNKIVSSSHVRFDKGGLVTELLSEHLPKELSSEGEQFNDSTPRVSR